MAVAIFFGVMFVKGSVKINLQKFFRVTTAILFFVAAQLVIGGLHELSENGVLPSSRREMAIIGPIVRNDLFFFVTILVLAALMVLFEMKRRQPVELPAAGAARRKALWTARRERLWMASVYVCSFVFIVMVTASFIYEKSASALSPATEVTFVNGKVIDSAEDRSTTATCIASRPREGGIEVRFWLYQKPDGKDRHPVRRLRNLRPGRLLQRSAGRGLQELRRAHQSAVGGHARRMQSHSAEGAGHRRRGHHLRGGRSGRQPLLRAEIMFPRLVYESFRRQTRRKLLAGIAITLGVAVATAMIAVATDIGDKINRELRSYGANLVVTPQEDTLDVEIGGVNLKPPSDGAFLNEADLPKIRGTFWHHNIVGFSPMLPVTVKLG